MGLTQLEKFFNLHQVNHNFFFFKEEIPDVIIFDKYSLTINMSTNFS